MDRPEHETTRAIARRKGDQRLPDERPYLLGVAGEYRDQLMPLENLKEVVFGRAPDAEFSLTLDDEVSRRHARVVLDEGGRAWVCDLGSTNGTLVNGREITTNTLLRRGDRIYVGLATIFKLDWLTDDEVQRLKLANVDTLTEVYSRRFLDVRLAELFKLAMDRDRPFSLIMLDIDHFKNINDTFGHLAGDLALQRVAASLHDTTEASVAEPLVCRFGGEEFTILLPGLALEGARALAERARAAIEALRVEYHGVAIPLTLSAGVASLPKDSAAALVADADRNLYRAKAEGRNRVV